MELGGLLTLTDDEKKILTVKAAVLLGRMASGEIAGYDIRMAAGALDASLSQA